MENSDHTFSNEMDPYFVLGLTYSATESEIQKAFHKKMQHADNQEIIIQAYSMIRNEAGRNSVRWNRFESYILNPFSDMEAETQIDIQALIKELAFLSQWELGEDECPN
jgi:hypothetical protein